MCRDICDSSVPFFAYCLRAAILAAMQAAMSSANRKTPVVLPVAKGLPRLPPQDVALEESVLGTIMLEKDALATVIDVLQPDSFYKEAHQHIYDAIVQLFNDGEPIDIRTVSNQVRKNGQLDAIGGNYYITSLTEKASSGTNIELHARTILEHAIKRQIIALTTAMQEGAANDETDILELLDGAEEIVYRITDENTRKQHNHMHLLWEASIDELAARRKHQQGITGIPSGFMRLDSITSGWQKSDLIIIAARPGMGKTAFALSTLRNAAIDYGYAVGIFSLEMSSIQLTNRLIMAEAELDGNKIRKGNLTAHEWEQMMHKTAKLSNAPIFIDDTPSLSIFELRAKCRRLKAKHNVQLLVIDYLQLMSAGRNKRMSNREQEIAAISRALKGIARELKVPVIALSQLSRAVENRKGDKRPQLSDLRESGAIEQDADVVAFLYRPKYYEQNEMSSTQQQDSAEIIIAKHRNGTQDTLSLNFIGRYTKFVERDIS